MKLRITVLLIMFSLAQIVCAQDASSGNGSQVSVTTFPESPITGVSWILSLFVDYASADKVSVIAPPFAPSLSLDRITKNPVRTSGGVQTVIDYRFIPASPGRFIIEPFTVITPLGETKTNPMVINVRKAGEEQQTVTAVLFWEGAPAHMAAGEKIVFTLRSNDWSAKIPPQQKYGDFFMPEVPQGVILAMLPVSTNEKEAGIVLKLNLILLDKDFILTERILQYENIRFVIPAINIRLN